MTLLLSHWCPWSGVVRDCIDSWSLPSFLLCKHTKSLDQDQTAVNCIHTVCYRHVKTGSLLVARLYHFNTSNMTSAVVICYMF